MAETTVTLRKAKTTDAQRILNYLITIANEPNIGILMTPERARSITLRQERKLIQEYTDAPNSVFLLAQAGTQIIGIATVEGGKSSFNQHRASIGITVLKEWRGYGIGKAMMEYIIDWGRKNNTVKLLTLEVFSDNEVAIQLYESLGFEKEGLHKKRLFKDDRYIDEYSMSMWVGEAETAE